MLYCLAKEKVVPCRAPRCRTEFQRRRGGGAVQAGQVRLAPLPNGAARSLKAREIGALVQRNRCLQGTEKSDWSIRAGLLVYASGVLVFAAGHTGGVPSVCAEQGGFRKRQNTT